MDFNRIQADEYELQFYEFSSTSFIKELKELILTKIREALIDLEQNCVLHMTEDQTHICHLEIKKLFEEYQKVTLKKLECVEDEIRNYFAIPKHVVLPEDINNKPCSKSDIENLTDEIKKLETIYVQKRAVKHLCEKELEILNDLEKLNNNVKVLVDKIKHLQNNKKKDSLQSLLTMYEKLLKNLTLVDNENEFVAK